MLRNPRYDVLFEPVRIGPVTAPNRFYSVPHSSGMTNRMPRTRAAFREMKAEGGWGVVCTGYVSIHPSSDDSPLPYASLWDDDDVRTFQLMTDAVHAHGALAGIELWHGGGSVFNRTSRLPPLSPSGIAAMPTHLGFMGRVQPRAMDAAAIRELLGMQAAAARRARSAGFDIVYVYAGMGYLPHQFLLPNWNQRTDAYGGSVANRCRLVRELLEVTREAVGDRCAVALRISLEELRALPGEHAESQAHEVVAALADWTDLFDVKMDSGPTDCGPSRFSPEGSHEATMAFVKSVTSKPVVGVGRFTSPDTMVSQIRRGVLDLIGGARPSIADPFLPKKIASGREADIRECIGCNICISSWHEAVPVRCTQNPTIGEEWRRGWHPERFVQAGARDSVLVVGAGPAGLECALTLARRGFDVALADGAHALGGRLLFETGLPGLAAWRRVLDWRRSQLEALPNVSIYLDSRLTADDVREFAPRHVVIATGARWSRMLYSPLEIPVGEPQGEGVFTPDDLAAGAQLEGPIVVFDFDNHYLGGVLALHLAQKNVVTYVTPAGHASEWAVLANERPQVHVALRHAGVELRTLSRVTRFEPGTVTLADLFTGAETRLACRSLLIVGARFGEDRLYNELMREPHQLERVGIESVTCIGDALAPGAIAHAIYSGHDCGRELGAPASEKRYLRDGPLQG
ncbi:MAG TPA: FAD-dependent oxidoreductase [Steroidobacter sp.]|uniref:oxidoreductase n=1 Tax=Steroidobacter sp. TaxID=1978227 RepID=UPI002EDB9D0E